MANVWHVFVYVACAFLTKKLQSAAVESHFVSDQVFLIDFEKC